MSAFAKIDPIRFAWLVLGVGAALWVYGKYSGSGLAKFIDAATFDRESLGPNVTKTNSAKLSEADYIRLGYAVRTASGQLKITPAGEAYIKLGRGQ